MLELAVGSVSVQTTSNRGFTPEEVAERCLDRIISVSDSAPRELKDQAMAYRKSIRALLLFYMDEAIRSDRPTCNTDALLSMPRRFFSNLLGLLGMLLALFRICLFLAASRGVFLV